MTMTMTTTTATPALYNYLSQRVPSSICGWLPHSVSRRGWLPATPRRIAWALRQIRACGYPGHCAYEAITGAKAEWSGDDATAQSVAAILRR